MGKSLLKIGKILDKNGKCLLKMGEICLLKMGKLFANITKFEEFKKVKKKLVFFNEISILKFKNVNFNGYFIEKY